MKEREMGKCDRMKGGKESAHWMLLQNIWSSAGASSKQVPVSGVVVTCNRVTC